MKKPGTMVLGIGNLLCRDDGIGVRVVEMMQQQDKYNGINIVDGGTDPDLMVLLEDNVARLIIVDALRAGGRPGDIHRFNLREDNIECAPAESLHGMSVLDSLRLMRQLGRKPPQIIVIGIEPEDVSHGLQLSPVIEELVPDIIEAVEREFEHLD